MTYNTVLKKFNEKYDNIEHCKLCYDENEGYSTGFKPMKSEEEKSNFMISLCARHGINKEEYHNMINLDIEYLKNRSKGLADNLPDNVFISDFILFAINIIETAMRKKTYCDCYYKREFMLKEKIKISHIENNFNKYPMDLINIAKSVEVGALKNTVIKTIEEGIAYGLYYFNKTIKTYDINELYHVKINYLEAKGTDAVIIFGFDKLQNNLYGNQQQILVSNFEIFDIFKIPRIIQSNNLQAKIEVLQKTGLLKYFNLKQTKIDNGI